VANVKKNFSMPERSAQLIEQYAKEVGLSQSAFVSLMVTQINQVVKSLPKKAIPALQVMTDGGPASQLQLRILPRERSG
jgi:hypothetical protein